MKCAWQAFINLLPVWMRESVDKQGRDTSQELRLRLNLPPQLITQKGIFTLQRSVCAEDLQFCINVASRYSPWTASTVSKCFITAPGGHRLGLCGNAVISNGRVCGVHPLTSVCIRVARDFPGIANKAAVHTGSVLIIGKPGSGKTTFLRDFIRQRSNTGDTVCVVDEREEVFPIVQNQHCYPTGNHTDVLSGCGKSQGIEAVLRNMGPDTIAVDEITAQEDCNALLHAGWCGVKLIATAHAGSREDLFRRPVYRPIIESNLFDTLIIMRWDKSWSAERMNK